MSQYLVIIEDADAVWPPVEFDDWLSAIRHAIRVAKTFEAVSGSPGIRVVGPNCGAGVSIGSQI